MNVAKARIMVENLPIHEIGGYEWECFTEGEHYHMSNRYCKDCDRTPTTDEGYVDMEGNVTSHDDLINKADVLRILSEE